MAAFDIPTDPEVLRALAKALLPYLEAVLIEQGKRDSLADAARLEGQFVQTDVLDEQNLFDWYRGTLGLTGTRSRILAQKGIKPRTIEQKGLPFLRNHIGQVSAQAIYDTYQAWRKAILRDEIR